VARFEFPDVLDYRAKSRRRPPIWFHSSRAGGRFLWHEVDLPGVKNMKGCASATEGIDDW